MRPWSVAAALLVLAGCGGGGGSSSPTTVATTSTTVQTATPQQLASIVAKDGPGIRRAVDAIEKGCDPNGCALAGDVSISTLSSTADILRIDLANVADPSKPRLYVGAVPSTMQSLVSATLAQAVAVKGYADDAAPCAHSGCPPLTLLILKMGGLVDELNAWQPYT